MSIFSVACRKRGLTKGVFTDANEGAQKGANASWHMRKPEFQWSGTVAQKARQTQNLRITPPPLIHHHLRQNINLAHSGRWGSEMEWLAALSSFNGPLLPDDSCAPREGPLPHFHKLSVTAIHNQEPKGMHKAQKIARTALKHFLNNLRITGHYLIKQGV